MLFTACLLLTCEYSFLLVIYLPILTSYGRPVAEIKRKSLEELDKVFYKLRLQSIADWGFRRAWRYFSKVCENSHVDPSQFPMHVMNGEEYNFLNSIKLYVECLTGETWNWWPFPPAFRQLLPDEYRLQWHCVSDHSRYFHLGLLMFQRSQDRFIGQCSPRLTLL